MPRFKSGWCLQKERHDENRAFLFVFVSAGHNIVCEFIRNIIYPKDNIIVRLRTQNDVMANAINDVMLRINDVTPCGVNDVLPSAKMIQLSALIHFRFYAIIHL